MNPTILVARWLPLLIAISFFQFCCFSFRANKSVTVDETCYLACGINTKELGRLDPMMVDLGIAPLPVLLEFVPVLDSKLKSVRANRFQGLPSDPDDVHRARRVTSWVVGSGLIAVCYVWMLGRRGVLYASFTAVLLAASPTIIAHCSLATTDALATLTWLLGALAICRFAQSQSFSTGASVALTIGFALAAKYSAVVAIPVVFITCVLIAFNSRQAGIHNLTERGRFDWIDAILATSAISVAAFAVCWGVHGFASTEFSSQHSAFATEATSFVSWFDGQTLPAPIGAILHQQLHNSRGHPTMLFGEVSMHGWWYYFPAVAVMKATLPELITVAAGLCLLLCRVVAGPFASSPRGSHSDVCHGSDVQRHRVSAEASDRAPFVLAIVLLVAGASLFFVRVQNGQRYMLPLFPIALLFSVDAIADATLGWRRRRGGDRILWAEAGLKKRLIVAICSIFGLATWQLGTAINSAPNYLAYLSPLFGSSENAYQLVFDSNLDWGQDLPSLRQEMDKLPSENVLLVYYGTALPSAYGIDIASGGRERTQLQDYDFIAISASALYGLSPTSTEMGPGFRFLLDKTPFSRAGESILIYDLRGLHRGKAPATRPESVPP